MKKPNTLVLLPGIPDDASETAKNALAIENSAAVSGVCPACGATGSIEYDRRHPRIVHLYFEHEDGCPSLLGAA